MRSFANVCFSETLLLTWDMRAESEERSQCEISLREEYKKYTYENLGWHTWGLYKQGNYRNATPHPRVGAVVRQCVDWIESFWVSELSEKQVRGPCSAVQHEHLDVAWFDAFLCVGRGP